MAGPLLDSLLFSIPSCVHSAFVFRGSQNTLDIYAEGHESVILWIHPAKF